jgi:xylitol oxidase
MEKRTFIKLSSALITGSMISPLIDWAQDDKLKNWAGNYEYSTNRLYHPKSVKEVQELVKKYSKLKVLGTRHCFNGIADSTDNLLSTANLDQVIDLDRNSHTVTVGGGIRYGQLAEYLYSNGFALHNLASLPHISVAGACTTATHGSGNKNGNLATAVVAMELVTAAGEVIELSREKNAEQFAGAVVGLGGLGVITKVTLNIQPTFMVRQDVYQNLSFDQLEHHFDDIMSAGYSVSLFTDWQNRNVNEVWIKRRIEPGQNLELKPDFFGARPATKNLHPIIDLSAENCTEQMGVPGPWHERLPHFRMGFTPSSGKELQSEYFVPRNKAYEAILAVERLHEQVGPHLMISEIRTVDADDLWMSPCYKQACATIHFTWKQDWPAVRKLLPQIEAQLATFNVRPHWGKLFTIPPARLKSLYEKLPDFQRLLKHYDPQGKFRNEFLNTNVYGSSS